MADLGKAYVQIIPSATGISGQIGQVLAPEADSAGKKAGQSVGNSIGGIAVKTIAALGVGKSIGDVISNGMNFEGAMAKASTLFSGTSSELAGLQEEILRISNATGVSAAQLAEAAYSAESASVPMENLGKMIENSSKLATAGFTDIDTALSATAKTMNAYGMVTDDVNANNAAMEQVQRILIQTQNKGITTVGELGASLANVTPTAAAAGVGFEQVGAALAQMTAKGTPTAQATTQLRSAIAELEKSGTKASLALEQAAAGTQYAGMSFTKMMASGADLSDVMSMLQKYADKSGLAMLDLWSSVEGGNAAMSIASDVATFKDDLDAMGTSADVVGDAYSTMSETVGFKLEKVKNILTNMGIGAFTGAADLAVGALEGLSSILEAVSGPLGTLKESLGGLFGNVVQYVSDMTGLNGQFSIAETVSTALSTALTALSAAIGFVSDHIGIFAPIITGLIANMAAVGIAGKIAGLISAVTSLGGVTGALGAAFTALGGPIGIAVLAITAVVTAVTYLWKTNEGFRTAVITAWNAVKAAVVGLGAKVKTELGNMKNVFTKIGAAIKSAWSGLCSVLGPVLSAAFGVVKTALSGAFSIIKGLLKIFIGVFTGDWKKAWEGVKQVFSTVWNAINGVWNTMLSVAKSVWESIKSAVSGPVETLKEVLSGAWDSIKDTASNAWDNIKSAMTSPIESAKNTISNLLSSIKGKFPLSIGKIFSNLKLPKIHVSGGEAPFGIGGQGKLPSFSVTWHKKAMEQPYLFSGATIFGAGEAGDEVLYGRQALIDDIREAVSGKGVTITNYITVNGAEDPEEYAQRFVRKLRLQMRTG